MGDESFHRLTRLAARACAAPLAEINLVDDGRQLSGSRFDPRGWAAGRAAPLADSLCRHVVTSREPLRIEDAGADPQVASIGRFTELGVRSYLGVPLLASEDQVIGTLCVFDLVPRAWSDEQVETLRDLAASVVTEIELRGTREAGEQFYRTMVESIRDYGVIRLGPDGRIQTWNAGAEIATGYSREEALGRHFSLFYRAEDIERGAPEQDLAEALRTGRAEREGWRLRKDGSQYLDHQVLTPIRTRNGELRGFVKVTRDQTERQRADEWERERILEQAARAESEVAERRAREILESITDAFVALDRDWRFTYLNRGGREAVRRLLQKEPGEVIGHVYWDVAPELLGTRFEEEFRRVMETRSEAHFEEFLPAWNTWFEVHAYPSSGDGIAVFFRDVNERKRLELRLHESEERFRTITESLSATVTIVDQAGTIRYRNPASELITGHLPEEKVGRSAFDSIHPDDLPRAREMFAGILARPGATATGDLRVRHRDGSWRTLQFMSKNLLDNPVVRGVIVSSIDVTERKRAEEALRQSEERFRLLVQSVKDYAIFMLDPQGCVASWNKGAERIKGYSEEEILGRHVSVFYPADEVARGRPQRLLDLAARVGRCEDEGWRVRRDGTLFWANIVITAVRAPRGELIGFTKVTRDLTDQYHTVEALRESEERFRQIAESIREIFWLRDPHAEQFLYVSPGFERIVGHLVASVYRHPDVWFDAVHPQDRSRFFDALRRTRMEATDVEYRILRPDGAVRWLWTQTQPVRDAAGNIYRVAGVTADITEHKRVDEALRESEERYRRLFENSPNPTWIYDPDTLAFLDVNEAAIRHYGYSRAEFLSMTLRDIRSPEHVPELRRVAEIVRETGGSIRRAAVHRKKDGGTILVEVSGQEVSWNGRPVRVVLVNDVTERQRAEAEVRKQLEEKTALLAEVHHRVKNNLQIISSLLNMQIRSLSSPAAVEALRESQSRTRAIALVHETLYHSGEFARIDLSEYLGRLVQQLHRLYGTGRGIELRLEMDPCAVPLGQAVPCGLLLNELITNTFKHAFPAGGVGEVRVSLSHDLGGRCTLRVSDDGAGIPQDLDLEKPRSVGLQLVRMLAEQVRADVEVRRRGGTEFIITFPIAEGAP